MCVARSIVERGVGEERKRSGWDGPKRRSSQVSFSAVAGFSLSSRCRNSEELCSRHCKAPEPTKDRRSKSVDVDRSVCAIPCRRTQQQQQFSLPLRLLFIAGGQGARFYIGLLHPVCSDDSFSVCVSVCECVSVGPHPSLPLETHNPLLLLHTSTPPPPPCCCYTATHPHTHTHSVHATAS